jgi:nucleotide-binding universal stress UspA family protein
MKKVLIAVDDTKYSKAVLSAFYNSVQSPEETILLHVEKPGGKSLMYDMLGDAEMSTFKEMLKGTKHKEALDKKAEKILTYYKKELEDGSRTSVRTVIREGHPAEEILKVAEEEDVELIILGYSGRKGINRLIAGSVTKDVEKNAKVPVLVAKNTLMCEEAYSWRDAYAAILVCTAVVFGLFILGVIVQNEALLP